MNKWFGCGRLTADPDVRAGNDRKYARFSIAVNDNREENGATFVPVVCFGRQADFAENYLHRGVKIIVEGRLQLGSYTNREGVRVNTADIICERIEFAESKNANTEQQTNAKRDDDGFMPIPDGVDDDGLPFN